ncbi:effector-associated domain 2-containing protein [Umezawaea sp. Da 62-37]|uniref:effector-associated domain 2-containing protein n=1 Tax=Umezawaea sp. Da 62-37 TaxID=3075927 RepID=UPI0028F6F7A5|nr:hypothetical protein [Umezawaea sp. Da 62-37]WNV88743.1 hypothetical protein RM788_10715 [Umezawaea sp. Da 62-37]
MALHRAIVLVDVAGFTDPVRTVQDQNSVHAALYKMLETSFDESGLNLKQCLVEDRGDGAMVLVPPEFPKSWLVDQWPTRLLAALRRHNALHAPPSQIRLRAAFHAGEIHQNDNGVVSQAVNLAFRILDAQQAREALAESGGLLALIASDPFYRETIMGDPATDPASYRRIAVLVKHTDVVAWLRLPDRSGALRPETARGALRTGNVFELVDAVLAVTAMRDAAGRQMVLDLLRPDISTSVFHDSRARLHVLALVRTCLGHDGGLAELIGVLRDVDGDSLAVRHLVDISSNWLSRPPP